METSSEVRGRASPGPLREEPERTGVRRPAGGALFPLRAGEAAAGRLPAADGQDEGPGVHHSARSGDGEGGGGRGRSLEPPHTCLRLVPADVETAQNALRLVHGYRGLGKPLVVEFGRERPEEVKK